MRTLLVALALAASACSGGYQWTAVPIETAAGLEESKMMCLRYAQDRCGFDLACRKLAMGQCMADRGWM